MFAAEAASVDIAYFGAVADPSFGVVCRFGSLQLLRGNRFDELAVPRIGLCLIQLFDFLGDFYPPLHPLLEQLANGVVTDERHFIGENTIPLEVGCVSY